MVSDVTDEQVGQLEEDDLDALHENGGIRSIGWHDTAAVGTSVGRCAWGDLLAQLRRVTSSRRSAVAGTLGLLIQVL